MDTLLNCLVTLKSHQDTKEMVRKAVMLLSHINIFPHPKHNMSATMDGMVTQMLLP